MRYKSLLLTIFCNLLYTDEIISDTFLSSPIQLPSGETVLGLGYLSGIRISPDNQTLLLYGKNGIFLIQDDHILRKRVFPDQFFARCEYSPDGSKLLISEYFHMYVNGFYQYNNMIYDLILENIILTLSENTTIPLYPFSPDGKVFVYYEPPGAMVAHLDSGLKTFLPNLSLNPYSFYSDNQQIINTQIRDSSPYLIIWDAQTGNEIRSVLLESPYKQLYTQGDIYSSSNWIEVLGWGKIPDSIVGDYVYLKPFSVLPEIYIHIWDNKTGKILKNWGVRYGATSYSSSYLELSPDRRWLVNNPEYYYAELIDLDKEPSEKPEPNLGPFEHIIRTAFTPDSQSLFLLASEYNHTKYTISQLDLGTHTLRNKQFLYWNSFKGCAFSPNGSSFAIYDATDQIKLWDWKQNKNSTNLFTTIPTTDSLGTQLAYSPDGKLILSGNSKTYSLWDTITGKQIKNFSTGDQPTQITVAFSRDGSKFLTAGYIKANTPQTNIVKIWETNTIAEIQTLKGHTSTILSAHFSPDGKQVITASDDQTAKVWNVETGQLISTYINPASGVYYAEFFSDGKRAVTADYDHTIHILNTETGAAQTILQNVNYPAVLSPNGKWLFAGTQVWDTVTWKIIKILDGKEMDLNSLAVSPDNLWLLTSETNGITKVWSIPEHIINHSGIKEYQKY